MERKEDSGPRGDGTQSLSRAIDLLEIVAEGPISLPDLTARLGLSKATVYRLATKLAERGLLSAEGRTGYRIGPRLAELGRAHRE